jgi:hypothetical protein
MPLSVLVTAPPTTIRGIKATAATAARAPSVADEAGDETGGGACCEEAGDDERGVLAESVGRGLHFVGGCHLLGDHGAEQQEVEQGGDEPGGEAGEGGGGGAGPACPDDERAEHGDGEHRDEGGIAEGHGGEVSDPPADPHGDGGGNARRDAQRERGGGSDGADVGRFAWAN